MVIYLWLKIEFLIGHHCKTMSELPDLLEKGRNYWCSYRVFLRSKASDANISIICNFVKTPISQALFSSLTSDCPVFILYLMLQHLTFMCVYWLIVFPISYWLIVYFYESANIMETTISWYVNVDHKQCSSSNISVCNRTWLTLYLRICNVVGIGFFFCTFTSEMCQSKKYINFTFAASSPSRKLNKFCLFRSANSGLGFTMASYEKIVWGINKNKYISFKNNHI